MRRARTNFRVFGDPSLVPEAKRTSRGEPLHADIKAIAGVSRLVRRAAGNDSAYLECDDIDFTSPRRIVTREVF